MVQSFISCPSQLFGLISKLRVNSFTKHFMLVRNLSIFKIKACLEVLNVLSFLVIAWWVFLKVSYFKHGCFLNMVIVCIGVSTPPLKPPPPLSFQAPQQTVQAPLCLGNLPPLYWFFMNPPSHPLKSQISHWTCKILKFFILNTILSFKSN